MSQLVPITLVKLKEKHERAVYSVKSAIPAFFPKHLADYIRSHIDKSGKLTITTRFSTGERAVLRKRKPIPVSEWAEKHRILESSSIRGRWKNMFTPYLTGIMDTAGNPHVETVIICKSPQTGGSESGHNLVGYCIDRMPGPVLYVFPDELTARENAKDRIIPMIDSSPRLRQYKTGYSDDASSLRINLSHMAIYLGWSGSASRLGNKSIRILILDELDKYKNPKNEASSEDLAEKRTTTWRNRRKIMKISTPTNENGPIWQALTVEANAIFDYFVVCPDCGFSQLMSFERISWAGKNNEQSQIHVLAEKIERGLAKKVLAEKSAVYVCERCGSCWTDAERDRAVRRGEWKERVTGLSLQTHLSVHKPIKVGFHIPAWLSYFVSLSEIVYAHLRYKESGNMEYLKDFLNQYCALPMEEVHELRAEDAIFALCDDRPRGAVPSSFDEKERVSVLLATVDTQKYYFRYNIRAYGYGLDEESWLVARGNAGSFEALEQILFDAEYTSATGEVYKVRAVMIDAMGEKTSQVYRWAIKHRGRVYPWQGVNSLSTVFVPSMQEYFPDQKGNKIKIPGGLMLYRCDVTFFKSDLSHKLTIHPDDRGALHLHSNEKKELNDYVEEMCAEVWDHEKNLWINPKKRANHDWDCEVMHRALAYILNVRFIPHPADKQVKKDKVKQSNISRSDRLRRR